MCKFNADELFSQLFYSKTTQGLSLKWLKMHVTHTHAHAKILCSKCIYVNDDKEDKKDSRAYGVFNGTADAKNSKFAHATHIPSYKYTHVHSYMLIYIQVCIYSSKYM